MMSRLLIYGIGTLLSLLLIANLPVQSQPVTPKHPLQVATRIIPPFVIQDHEHLTGFSRELWTEITQELGIKFKLSVYPTVNDLLLAIASKKAELGIAPISLTAKREKNKELLVELLPQFGCLPVWYLLPILRLL